MGAAFAARHKADRYFWPAYALAAWVLVFIGFAGTVTRRFAGQADFPAPVELVIHVWSFAGWLSLLCLQLLLSRSGRIDLHRKLGWAALALVPVMAWSAIAAEIHGERFYASRYDDVIRFFPIPCWSVLSFTLCALAAVALRKDRAAHMRLIYLATASVLVATFFRWWGDAIYDALAPGFWTEWIANYIGVVLLMALGVGYDLLTRGIVHRVYRVGVPLIVAGQLGAVTIGQSDWWPPFGERLIGIT